jgi:hypothetical protein
VFADENYDQADTLDERIAAQGYRWFRAETGTRTLYNRWP